MNRMSHQSAGVTSPLVDDLAAIHSRPKARFESLMSFLKSLIRSMRACAPPRSVDDDTYYLPSDRLSLEIGRYAAERITPSRLADFKLFIQRLKDDQPGPYVVDWSKAVDEGVSSVSRILRDPTNYGQTMRSVISFRPLVAKDELMAIRHNYFKESHGARRL